MFKLSGFFYLVLVFVAFCAFQYKYYIIDLLNFYFNSHINPFNGTKYIVTSLYFILMPGVVLATCQIMLTLLPKQITKFNFNKLPTLVSYSLKLLIHLALIVFTLLIIFFLLKVVYSDFLKPYYPTGLGFLSGNPYYLSSKWIIHWIFSLLVFPLPLVIALTVVAYKYSVFTTKTLLGSDTLIIKNNNCLFNILQLILILLVILFHFAYAHNVGLYVQQYKLGLKISPEIINNMYFMRLYINVALFLLVYTALLRSAFFSIKTHIAFLILLVIASVLLFHMATLLTVNGTPVGYIITNPRFQHLDHLLYFERYKRFFPLSSLPYYFTIHLFAKYKYFYSLQNLAYYLLLIFITVLSLRLEGIKNKFLILLMILIILLLPLMISVLYIYETFYSELVQSLFIMLFIAGWTFTSKFKNSSYIYYILSFIPLFIATYMKEPTFLISLTIGTGLLIFKYNKLSKPEKLFAYLLILNAAIFLTLFTINALVVDKGGFYDSINISFFSLSNRVNSFIVINSVLNYGLIIAIIFAVYRLSSLIIHKVKNSSLGVDLLRADLILCSGIAYLLFFPLYFTTTYLTGNTYFFIPGVLLTAYALIIQVKVLYEHYSNKSKTKLLLILMLASFIFLAVIKTGLKQGFSVMSARMIKAYEHQEAVKYLYTMGKLEPKSSNLSFKFNKFYILAELVHKLSLMHKAILFHYSSTSTTQAVTQNKFVFIKLNSYHEFSGTNSQLWRHIIKCNPKVKTIYFLGKYIINQGITYYIYLTAKPPLAKYPIKPILLDYKNICK